MDELIRQVAEDKGYPEDLVLRAARARAAVSGTSVEALLQAWAGGAAPAASAPPPAESPAPAATPPPPAPGPAETPSGPAVEVLEPVAAPAAGEGPVAADAVTEEPEELPVAAGAMARWLVAAFVIVPVLALMYALWVPNGPDCGEAGRLALDPVTGEAENCDGSPYGVEIVNFFTIGRDLYEGECASCHGVDGGGGTGPAMAGGAVLATFPEGTCSEHVEWVLLGSAQWPEPTYGAQATPVGGSGANMPGFAGLTPEELASVVLYERVQFGGQDLPGGEEDCGLTEVEMAAAGG